MAAHRLDPLKVATFALLVSKGQSMTASAKEAKISWPTVMRQMKDPTSPIVIALASHNIHKGGIPGWEKYTLNAQRALTDFGFFREYFFARSTSPWAEEAAYKVVELLATDREEYLVVNIAPGTGKSTFFTHDLPAWILARDRSKSLMIGSASQNLANGYVNRLRNSFERTIPEKADRKLLDLGLAKDAESTLPLSYGRFRAVQGGVWSRNQFDIAQIDGEARGEKESSVVAYGIDAGFLGGRFDFVIWDDLVTNKTLATEGARDKLIKDWEAESETRLEPEGLLILQGQRLGPSDLYRHCLDLKEFTELDIPNEQVPKKYHHVSFKAHYDENCQGDHGRDATPWPKGCLLEPRRLDWRKLMNTKINNEGNYLTVYQQEDVDTKTSLVKSIWIDGGEDSETNQVLPGCWDTRRKIGSVEMLKGVDGFSVVTVDPSPTKYWAIMWWLYSPEDQLFYLVDMERKPMEAPDFLDYNIAERAFSGLLEEWVQRAKGLGRPITDLIMENNAAQKFMNQYNYWKMWSAINSVTITGHQTNATNKTDEEYGVQTIAPHFRYGRVRLPGDEMSGSKAAVAQFVKELTEYPNSRTDDTVMSFWFLVWQAPNIFDSLRIPDYSFDRPSWIAGSVERVAIM